MKSRIKRWNLNNFWNYNQSEKISTAPQYKLMMMIIKNNWQKKKNLIIGGSVFLNLITYLKQVAEHFFLCCQAGRQDILSKGCCMTMAWLKNNNNKQEKGDYYFT
jgi:hypothetical protein